MSTKQHQHHGPRASIRRIKRRAVSAMGSTVRVQLRLPAGMSHSDAIRALRKLTKNAIRPFLPSAAANGCGN